MNITITDLEANSSLETEAMNALSGGCCYHPPVCCCVPPRPPWFGGCFKPHFRLKRISYRGRRRFNARRLLRA